MNTEIHTHSFTCNSSNVKGHSHELSGTTGNPVVTGKTHVHFFQGSTTTINGHVHHFSGVTGPAIQLSDGSHVHRYHGATSYDQYHAHMFMSLSEAVKYVDLVKAGN